MFKKTAQYEEKYGKDCSQFGYNEIIEMYTGFGAKSVYVLMNYNVIIKAYCAWKQYYHGLEWNIEYEDITIETLRPLVPNTANKILSRQDIMDIEDQLYNWTDKAIVEALWEGLAGNSMRDLVGINVSMIDHKAKQLYLPDGRVFDLTDRLYEFLTRAFGETEYVCYGSTLRIKKLVGTGHLYKERDNAWAADSDDKFFRWVYRKVCNFRDQVGISGLTMKNISVSGMAHYLRDGMEQTGLDLKSFLKTEMGEKLMDKYNYKSDFRRDNVYHRYSQLV